MQILNIAGYKFLPLSQLGELRTQLLALCTRLKGTILISEEGININLTGLIADIDYFKTAFANDPRFSDITFRESYSQSLSFKRLKVKIKKEIITFRQETVHPTEERAPAISPEEFKQWLDNQSDITILDTRNRFEVEMGSFANAVCLNINQFCEFPEAVQPLDKQKPVVMFCTGGIRCEKASLYLLKNGFSNVYQLDGGILNYFAKVGGAHFEGNCFVFDERIALNPNLESV